MSAAIDSFASVISRYMTTHQLVNAREIMGIFDFFQTCQVYCSRQMYHTLYTLFYMLINVKLHYKLRGLKVQMASLMFIFHIM